jgi:peptide chain release factor 2
MNMASAMKQLKAKLLVIEEAKRDAEIKGLSGPKTDIGFGHQIRTYTFTPYQLVKDERTGFKKGNVDAVMEGDLAEFLEAYLRSKEGKDLKGGNRPEDDRPS